MPKHRVDIVVPVYNEPENTRTFYECIRKQVQSDWRLLIVYDFEEDTTLPVVRELMERDDRVQLVRNYKKGVINAMKTGLYAAECEAVCAAMVDDPEGVIKAFDAMTTAFYKKEATVVVASRYMRDGSHTGGPVIKGLLSRLAGLSLHFLIRLPTYDATYNTRMYRKSFLEEITVESSQGFEIALEIVVKAHLLKRTIIEVPVHWSEREVGESRFKILKWIGAYSYWYAYAISHYWFPWFFRA